jgi:hypothetical protein
MTKYEYKKTKEIMEESRKENRLNRAQNRKLIACTTGSGSYKPLSLGSDVLGLSKVTLKVAIPTALSWPLLGLNKGNAKGRYTDCAILAPTRTQYAFKLFS